LREATASDVDRLAELEQASFGAEAWSRRLVFEELTGPHRRYFVAEAGGRVTGYAGLFLGLDSAEVMTVAVDPAWRGRGLGRRLMLALLTEAERAGKRRVMLEVAVGSEAAIGLYRSLGFAQIGRRRGYYQPSGRDALVMRLDLAPAGAAGVQPLM
jgi:N6-L-threonylcarbamoyladenine synthase/ribosomal-protein-alanine N-acetyltransferase